MPFAHAPNASWLRMRSRAPRARFWREPLAPAILAAALMSCGSQTARPDSANQTQREPIVGLPCEGCEAVFQGIPKELGWQARIAPLEEPGEALRIEGTVRDKDGRPTPDIIVYAYQTNARGLYPTDPESADMEAHRHGRLRGWAKTDNQGRYRFDTIRPAGYPDTNIPAHVHMHVLEPGRCTYYVDDLLFEDDPRLTPGLRAELSLGRGGPGLAAPQAIPPGAWSVTRDIVLGANIPGYPERGSR